MILYALHTLVVLGVTLSFYKLLLKTEKSFLFNRVYLLTTLLLGLTTPLLQIETTEKIPIISEANIEPLTSFTQVSNETINSVTVQEFERSTNYNFGIYFYWGISLVLLLRFLKNLIVIWLQLLKSSTIINGLKIIYISGNHSLSSFFNYLFVSKDRYGETLDTDLIQHELAHSQQLHSIDILVLEFLTCFFWFNPFIWLYKKEIVENHEFLADQNVIDSGFKIQYYTHRIIQSGNRNHAINLTSGFSFIQTKNRLAMLHKKESSVVKRAMKFSVVIFLSLGIFTISSFNYNSKPFVVVVDAGHGGKDPGNIAKRELKEKQINLEISKKLKALSNDKEVKIILTRSSDEFMELQERVRVSNSHKADFFLSLHCNAMSSKRYNNQSGIEAYYSNNGKFKKASQKYSEILISDHLETICEKGKIKTADFVVLKKHNEAPSVLLELGFLNNETERKRLSNPDHQNEIAKTIFKSLIKIKNLK